jgi:Family of unknown function (DUF5397)
MKKCQTMAPRKRIKRSDVVRREDVSIGTPAPELPAMLRAFDPARHGGEAMAGPAVGKEFPLADCVGSDSLPKAVGADSILTPVVPPFVPVGEIKCFGPSGPMYEVGQALRQLDDGDWMIEIAMVETGEKAEYRWTHLTDDPQAH